MNPKKFLCGLRGLRGLIFWIALFKIVCAIELLYPFTPKAVINSVRSYSCFLPMCDDGGTEFDWDEGGGGFITLW
jgi:hypothetical protein